MRNCLLFAVAAMLSVGGLQAQPKGKPVAGAEKFEAFRDFRSALTLKQGITERYSPMKSGNVNLDPPSADDVAVLYDVAKSLVYPLTLAEVYLPIPIGSDASELVVKSFEASTLTKIFNKLRGELAPVVPGIQPQFVAFNREFGIQLVKAIDDILAKGPPAVVRINAIRVLAIVAESGNPAALKKTIDLMKTRNEPNVKLDTLYHALHSAEACLGSLDNERILRVEKGWTTKAMAFELIKLVDEFVNDVPGAIISGTFQPENTTATLTTDAIAPGTPAPLSAEQVASVQFFRLAAVKALAKVKSDIVKLEANLAPGGKEQEVRPLFTLARIAMSDATLVARPSNKEVGEALLGLMTALPGESVDADMLGAVIARASMDFSNPRVADQKNVDSSVGALPWKIFGTRLETASTNYEKNLKDFKTKLPKEGKDLLANAMQKLQRDCFMPMAKNGTLTMSSIEAFFEECSKALLKKKAAVLFVDQPAKLLAWPK